MLETPQFGTAEYQPEVGGDHCKTCGLAIAGSYFRINGAITCSACADQTGERLPKDTHGGFARGVLFGVGGALVGLVLYSVVGIATGLEIGYVSLAVGYIVGRAIMMGTSGVGGRRHQIAAVLLTYAAVSMSAVPISLWHFAHEDSETRAAEGLTVDAQTEQAPPESESSSSSSTGAAGFIGAIAFLVVLGLVAPFLGLEDPVSGLIGLVILFVGIRIAWKMTAGSSVQITGPYSA